MENATFIFFLDDLKERAEAEAGFGRDANGVGEERLEGFEGVEAGDDVDFIEDEQGLLFLAADFREDDVDGFDLLEGVGAGDIDNVEEQIGGNGLFEGCLEGLD